MTDDLLSFKDMCARFDVTPRTLRYYEYIELLQPHKEGRARFYGPREVRRMEVILRGKRFGFSLEEIRQWLILSQSQGAEAERRSIVDIADRKLGELVRQREALDRAIVDLRAMRDEAARTLQG
ncbi:MerR family transcriptional regulator [Falsirhodobacter sp. 20TX0035]|uniref:MerR family transcriptional regulator n=1 Tax=Falsirhodobacter sp. 20TX0035 TaxID=3022019 RepID=UPI00232B8353|nr:MerR family DNA-binding protein [Falsirhodobacter sp. 20TX0035]MDB6452301.1 MerR family DNA-binding protein [Falsirhodobacter sp. 20TX0035]